MGVAPATGNAGVSLPAGAKRALLAERELADLGTDAAFERFFQALCHQAKLAGRAAPNRRRTAKSFTRRFCGRWNATGRNTAIVAFPIGRTCWRSPSRSPRCILTPSLFLTALLHDVVEDTPATLEQGGRKIRRGCRPPRQWGDQAGAD